MAEIKVDVLVVEDIWLAVLSVAEDREVCDAIFIL